MSRVPWWGPVVALALSSSEAAGGVVHGLVTMPVSSSEAAMSDVVVYVDSVPARVPRHWGGRVRAPIVIQQRQQFTPSVVAVVVGTRVQFRNQDGIYHNVFSVSPAKPFDLGKLQPTRARRVTFDRPGIVQLFCDLHPGEAGWVVVLPHRHFAQPRRDGSFRLPWLPPGHYRIHVWHPTLGEQVRPLEVPERGDLALELDY